ncbi:hypothetical protein AAFF_G00013910 [Aldrovandia affinis]|uniref:Uncharacterized protein n=1 Tax=Aldrovandia affinis TaxID=143900 RepID=A0AAD7WH48_9TELE|nr:hypothetical protein AAFF_G00013910 [Aldrovandia affinis]
MQQINADIEYLKRTTDTQTTACETLRVVSATLNNRLTAVEKSRGQGATSSAASLSAAEIQPGPVPGSSLAVVERPLGPGETNDIQPAQPEDSAQGRTQSPAWSKVVREGRRQKQVPENSAQQRHIPRTVKTPARHERKKTGIIGTGVVSNILAVKTKMVSVFATKFDLNVDADTLSDYLKEKLGRELWLAGSFVWRFYEPRPPRGTVGGPSGPEGTPRPQETGLLPGGDTGVPVVSAGMAGMTASCPAVSDQD